MAYRYTVPCAHWEGFVSLEREIRRARRARGWSQDKLAEEAERLPGAPEISRDMIQRLEAGRREVLLDPEEEPLGWVIRALGAGAALRNAVWQALGLTA